MYATCFLVLWIFMSTIAAENTYMVLVPNTIRAGATLRIAVHFLKPLSGETVTAELLTWQNDSLAKTTSSATKGPGNTFTLPERVYGDIKKLWSSGNKEGKFPLLGPTSGGAIQDIVLELTAPLNITWTQYRVKVWGEGPVNFKNETTISGNPRSLAIFVQTDKAAYKPGDTVLYRVFAIDSSLKPSKSFLDIEIFNPRNDKIDEKMGQDNLKPDGIQGSLPLPDMPVLGSYRIQVQVAGMENGNENYYFEVLEYVLPKFEVIVALSSYGKTSDTELIGAVKAVYTFGKPVVGNVKLQVKQRYGGGFYDPAAAQTEFPIDGTAPFKIPMTLIGRLVRFLDLNTVQVVANVTETATGITQQGIAYITFYKSPYVVEFFPNMPDNFKPGFGPYPVRIRVKERDERPPVSPMHKVKVTTNFFTDKPIQGPMQKGALKFLNVDVISPFILGDTIMIKEKRYDLNEKGIVEFDVLIPANTATFTIKAEFQDEVVYKEVSRFRSPNDVFLKIEMTNATGLQIGDKATVEFSSKTNPSKLNYLVLSRGSIVAFGTVPFSSGSFKFNITKEMAPSSRLVAYFINTDGEIVADGLNFVVEDIFENKVSVEYDKNQVVPKASVNLKVTADSGSLVNVLAVDKSVILFRQGNDITPQRVIEKMSIFGDFPFISRGWGLIWPWYFNADDASDIFNNANLDVLTDSNLYSFNLWSVQRRGLSAVNSVRFGNEDAIMSTSNTDAVEPQGQVRTDFPETWMWASKTAANGRAIFPGFAPDTITDFVANAYAIHPVTGLGVAPVTSNLTVFLPFFVNLQLPYSVIRGELAVIQANVFNYRGNGSTEYATVRLKFSKEYDIISVNGTGVETIQTEDYVQCVKTTQGGVTPVFFYIRPNTIGTIKLSVRATNPRPVNIFDEVIRQLPVKAEGIQKSKNQPVLISIQTPGTQVATRNITFPNVGLVPESEKIRVTIIGDLFGPSLANIDDVVNLPSGTGEQNLLSFGPAVYATVYMKSTGRFDGNVALQDKIRKILMTGYQRELIFQRGDGSFSDFGNADDSGSLWLTAFVVRIFAQAAQLDMITIDSKVVDRAVKYIINQQTTSGNFVSTGTLAHPSMQGGSSSSVNSLTAFILIALNEVKTADILTDPSTIASLTASISSATSFLVGRIPTMTTDYERAICAYALVKTSVAQANTILTRLESSPNLTIEGNSKYWKNDMSSSLTTETTAYVLLTYSVKNDRANGLLVLQWLVKQRNAFGGFSTQDTIVGLHALTEFARLIYSKSVDLTLYIRSKTNGVEKLEATLTLTSDNHDVLQYVDIPDVVDMIIVRGAGTGLALVDIIQFYNIKQEALPPKFDLKITTSDETLLSYALRVCASYNFPQSGSNMAILDVGFISGFEPEIDKVDVTGNLKRKELAGGRLILYFNEIPSKPVCVDVVARRLSYVIGVRSATVVLYSYYNPEERTMKEYLPSNLKALGLCRLCPTCCAPKVLPLSTCGSRQ